MSAAWFSADVVCVVVHGRGGPLDRGRFIQEAVFSQAPGCVNGRLRIALQGELLFHKLGFQEITVQELDQYTAALASCTCLKSK